MNKKNQLKLTNRALVSFIESLEIHLRWQSQDLETVNATAEADENTLMKLRGEIVSLERDKNFVSRQLETARQDARVCDPDEVFNIISTDWIRSHSKIDLIKLVRKMTNSGLKEAKDLTEAFLADLGVKSGSIMPENKT